jgi:hypothetical protein
VIDGLIDGAMQARRTPLYIPLLLGNRIRFLRREGLANEGIEHQSSDLARSLNVNARPPAHETLVALAMDRSCLSESSNRAS